MLRLDNDNDERPRSLERLNACHKLAKTGYHYLLRYEWRGFESQHSEQPSELNVLPRGTVVVPGTQSPRRLIPYKLPDIGKIQPVLQPQDGDRETERGARLPTY